MIKGFFILLISFALVCGFCSGQVRTDTIATERTDEEVEDLLENSTRDVEDSELLDFLLRLEENPLDVNTASVEELQRVPGITPFLAQSITAYRQLYGDFESINELEAVDGMTEKAFQTMRKYLTVGGEIFGRSKFLENIRFSLRSRAIHDLEERKGFQDSTYPGSPLKTYNRFVLRYAKNLEGGLLFEKDAGEQNFNDLSIGYLHFKDFQFISDALIGNYVLEFGQGITFWRSVGFSKGSEVVYPVKKVGRGVRPYLSTDENNFLRGAAVTLNLFNTEATVFYSNNTLDASVDTTESVSSFDVSGYHRTEREMRRDNMVREQLFGGRISYKRNEDFRLGLTYYRTTFDKEIVSNRVYQFSGTESSVFGADYDLYRQNLNFFGEWARTADASIGGVTGLLVTFGKKANLAWVFRHYPREFISLHGYGFGESSGDTQNESGMYLGVNLQPLSWLEISAYYDQFKFPWRTFFNPLPTVGNDMLLQTELKPLKGIEVTLRYKRETKETTESALDEFQREVKRLTNRTQQNARLQISYAVSPELRLRGRVEYVDVTYDQFTTNGSGILLYQEIRFKPTSNLTIDGRIVFFDTDSYDARIYEFENDVRGVLYNVGLSGKGRRIYLIVRYSVFRYLELSAKYAQTFYDGVKTIGSGEDEIKGNVASRLALQLEVKF
jgi:competence ComEA-like helix-hairpin-helix protein